MAIDSYGASSGAARWDLDEVVHQLRVSREATHNIRHQRRVRELPSRAELVQILEGLSAALFPTHYGRPNLTDESIDYFVGDTLNTTLDRLHEQVRRGLQFGAEVAETEEDQARAALGITRAFAASLPQIRALVVSDVQAAYAGDPAATSIAEILL